MINGGEAQRAFDRSRRNIREQLSTKDFERLEQMSSLDSFVEEGQRIGNELKTKGSSSAASKAGDLALNIEPYARIVEGLCKLVPIGGDLLWGVVSFLLVTSGTNANVLGDVLSFFTGIAEEIGHLKLVEDTFLGSEIIVTALGAVYVAIIEFWVKAIEYYTEKMKTDVRSRIKMWLISSTILSREFAKLKNKISAQRTKLHEVEASQNHAIEKAERVRRQRKEISDFISAPEYDNHLHAAERDRHDGTCEWLRHKEEYRGWIGRLTSGLLVIYGTAGAGKTILSSWLINEAQSRSAQHITLYHFFKGTNEKSNTALSATRSLLHQAYVFFLSTHDLLAETLESRIQDLLLQPSIRFESLWDIFSPLISEYSQRSKQEPGPTVTLILDAMDECKDSRDLVKNLRQLVHATSNMIHIVVTGRPTGEHVDAFVPDDPRQAPPKVLHIAPNDVQDDIAAFVKHCINHIERLGDSKHLPLRDRTIATLSNVKNHQGMFLWADLMCKEVQKQQRITGIETLLDRLPHGLTGMYERICERLLASEEIDREFSRWVLEWVVASKRPMTFAELEQALKFTTTGDVGLVDKFFDGDGGLIWSRRDIVKCCGDLVRYSGLDEGDTISIVHLSAQQFLSTRTQNPSSDALAVLKSFFIDIPSAQLSISLTCIKYLLSTSLHSHEYLSGPIGSDITKRNVFKDRYPLFDYATIYWVDYATDATESGRTSDATQLQQLLTAIMEFTCSPVATIWLEELVRLTYVEFAQHVIRHLRRLDAVLPPGALTWMDLVYKILIEYSRTLSSKPEVLRLCVSQPRFPLSDSSATISFPAEKRDWMYYDPNNDNIISITRDVFRCQSLKTGIRFRSLLLPRNVWPAGAYLGFRFAAASPSANCVAALYDLYDGGKFIGYLLICWSINNFSTISSIEDWATLLFNELIPAFGCSYEPSVVVHWVDDDTFLTPRGAFDLRTKSYVDVLPSIYELISESVYTYTFSGDSKRIARIKDDVLEVLSTEGVSVCQVKVPESPHYHTQSISHSGGKVVVGSATTLCCIVVDEARHIDMSFAPLHSSTTTVFTRDERQFVAVVDRSLTVWTFQRELDGSYCSHADMTHVFASQSYWVFDLVPGAALIVDNNGNFIRQPLDTEHPAGQTTNWTKESLMVLKYTGPVPELNICSIKHSLVVIEQWSLELPHPKLISCKESPMPVDGDHTLRAYSPHGTYLVIGRWIIDTRTLSSESGVCKLNLPEDSQNDRCHFNTDETRFSYSYIVGRRWTVCVLAISEGLDVIQRGEFTFGDEVWLPRSLFSEHNPALLLVGNYLLRLDNHRLVVETQIEENIRGFSDCGSYYYDAHRKLYALPAGLVSKVKPPMDIRYLMSIEDFVYPPHKFRLRTWVGIVFIEHSLDKMRRRRVLYVLPDGMSIKPQECYLIWPKEDVENMTLLLLFEGEPIFKLIDTGIRRGDLMNEGEWTLL